MAMLKRFTDTQVLAANGAIDPIESVVVITKGTAATITIPDPQNWDNGMIVHIVSTTAAAHTVAGTINGSSQTGTFAAAIGNGFTLVAYGGGWYVLSNINVTIA